LRLAHLLPIRAHPRRSAARFGFSIANFGNSGDFGNLAQLNHLQRTPGALAVFCGKTSRTKRKRRS
jgi:hypothetical protein